MSGGGSCPRDPGLGWHHHRNILQDCSVFQILYHVAIGNCKWSWSNSMRLRHVYDEWVLDRIFVEGVQQPNWHSIQAYWSTLRTTQFLSSRYNATSLMKLQKAVHPWEHSATYMNNLQNWNSGHSSRHKETTSRIWSSRTVSLSRWYSGKKVGVDTLNDARVASLTSFTPTVVTMDSIDGLDSVQNCRVFLEKSVRASRCPWFHFHTVPSWYRIPWRTWRLFPDKNCHFTGRKIDDRVHHRRALGFRYPRRGRRDPLSTIVSRGSLRVSLHSVRERQTTEQGCCGSLYRGKTLVHKTDLLRVQEKEERPRKVLWIWKKNSRCASLVMERGPIIWIQRSSSLIALVIKRKLC